MKIKFDNGSEINIIDTDEPFRSEVNNQRLIDYVDSVSPYNSSSYNLWKDMDWTRITSWLGGQIEHMKAEGLTEDEIIEELSKYCEVRKVDE